MKQKCFNMKHRRAIGENEAKNRRFSPIDTQPCDRCGHETYKLMCKEVCPNCGGRRDCSDV